MSGLKTCCMGLALLMLWGGRAAAKDAITLAEAPRPPEKIQAAATPPVTPLTLNGPMVSSSITQPGEWKLFSFVSNVPAANNVTFEVIPGTLQNFEFAYQLVTSEWNPYNRVTSGGILYSAKMYCRFDYATTRYIIVRAYDGTSTGSFSIHVTNGPALSKFSINNGAVSTPYSNVDLNYTFLLYNVTPTGYSLLSSESPDFSGATWQPYANPLKYRLSSGLGLKTVYLKLRDAKGSESAVYADTIYLNQLQYMTLNGPPLNGTVAISDEEVCFPFTITAQGRYWIETTTLSNGPASTKIYGAGLAITDTPVPGEANVRAINTDLPPGNYVAKVKAMSLPCNFTIHLTYGGFVTSFAINNNASDTSSRLVTLTSVATNSPTHYKASVNYNFADALWMPYASTIPFKLNGSSGLKTVYFKVKYANGGESEIKTGKINLSDLLTLEVDDDWITGNIVSAGGIDTWLLTIKTAGSYTIESRCGTLKDTLLVVYRQDDPKTVVAQDDDSGRNYAAKIDATLEPGTYLVKVTTPFFDAGSYSVKVRKN